ncbi:nuclear pore complex assembly-domain-containing protein [Lactarius hengduanensis]|nr:nuclear pore complex assembly-domain-containing protein [Lactarius hengduanensis]
MDADLPEPLAGDLMSLFELSPEGFPWSAPRPHEIETRRAQLSDLLIFDILLASGGVRQPDSLWPPTDPSSLRRLLSAIEESTYDTLKKDCLIYFLLKWHQDGREEGFKEQRCIPPQFAMLSDAYWHLDSGIYVERAVSLLCDVRLNRDYTSKIIQAISLSDAPTRLLLQYLRTAKPMLTEPDDMDTYILALAEESLISAWQYQRTFPDKSEIRTRLARKVLFWCFSPKPRPEHLKQLISFPLSTFEQSLLHDFALDPPISFPASSIPVLQDLVCVRLIQSGQYVGALKLDRQYASTQRGTQAPQFADRRRKMIEDVIAALPSIERLEIEERLRAIPQHKPEAPPKPAQTKAPADLSMSWEEIPLPPRIVSATSGAPRFVLGRNTHGHIQQKAAAGPTKEIAPVPAVLPLVPSVHTTTGAGNYVPPGLNGTSYTQNAAPPPIANARVKLFGSGQPAGKPSPNTSGSTSHRSSPLFPSSAPPSQNAPHSINDQTILYNRQGALPEEPRIEESSSQRGTAPQFAPETRFEDRGRNPIQPPGPSSVAEFSESVFVGSRAAHSPHTRETVEPALPGAFRVEREGPHLESSSFAHSPPTPPTRPRPAKSRRTARTSVPGGFDDVASGEEDNVPPLPDVSPVKRPTRRRASRASSVDGDEDRAPVKPKPRRSSRLSAASSSPDPSPQKTSAPKATRKTRAPAGGSGTSGGATATRSSTRKKR